MLVHQETCSELSLRISLRKMQQKFFPSSPFLPQAKFGKSPGINNKTISQWPKKAKPKRGNSTGSAGGRSSVHLKTGWVVLGTALMG
jgi:hypothetical protein